MGLFETLLGVLAGTAIAIFAESYSGVRAVEHHLYSRAGTPMEHEDRVPARGRRFPPFGAVSVLVLLLAALLFSPSCRRLRPAAPEPAPEPRPVAARGDLAADEKATIDLFREASPSVVFITSLARRSGGVCRG